MTTLDPARVARALTLDVETIDDGYRVTGGSEPHVVRLSGQRWLCDCADALYNAGVCKHRLAVHLARQLDHRVREALACLAMGKIA